MPMRRWLVPAITIAILLILFLTVDLGKALKTIANSEPGYLAIAAFLSLLFPVLCAVRWSLIVRQLGAEMGFWRSYQIIMAAWPLGAVTPAKSGDLIKLIFLKNVLSYSQTTGVILAERLVDVVALCVYAIVFGWVFQLYAGMMIGGSILTGVVCFFIVAATDWIRYIPKRYRLLVSNILRASKEMCRHTRPFVVILVVSFLNWFLSIVQTWLCYRAFHASVPLFYIAAALPVAIFVGLIPITVSGMGTRDSAIRVLFHAYASPEINLSVGILYSIFGYWLLSLLGLPFLKSAFRGSIHGITKQELMQEVYREGADDSIR